ncbi:MAG: hypothetical protein DLM61_01975 [Pseudonocardiales bacterium]|nr:MAG: hypothetical protein DLM61_01975 [Pseudonocardiales bacterium]
MAQVRILPGAPRLTRYDGEQNSASDGSWNHSWIQRRYSPSMAGRRSRSRGHIETLPSGSFRAKVYAGIDPLTRKRRYVVETAASEGAAKIALTKLQRVATRRLLPISADQPENPRTAPRGAHRRGDGRCRPRPHPGHGGPRRGIPDRRPAQQRGTVLPDHHDRRL